MTQGDSHALDHDGREDMDGMSKGLAPMLRTDTCVQSRNDVVTKLRTIVTKPKGDETW